MNKLLSAQLTESIASIDAAPSPSHEQLLEMRTAYRDHLVKLQRFAQGAEEAHRLAPTKIPVWGTAAACTQLYRDLCRTPAGALAGPVVVSLVRHFRQGARS